MVKQEWFVADFETVNTEPTRVWLYCLYGEDGYDVGYSIEDFFNDSIFRRTPFYNKLTIYFHNVNFDGTFILDYLLRVLKFEFTQNRKPGKGEFTCFIDSRNIFYSITVNINNCIISFLDSYKKLPFGADTIAKNFNTEVTKGIIDYDKIRNIGYVPTSDEIEYCVNDCRIIYEALKNLMDIGLKKITIGSDCMTEFKSIIGKENFNRLFPNLDYAVELCTNEIMTVDEYCRKAYFGGITYVNPQYAGKINNKTDVFDVNSLYPYVMYTKRYPAFLPKYGVGKPPFKKNMIYFIRAVFSYNLKTKKVPCIANKKGFLMGTASWSDCNYGNEEIIYFNSIDYELIKECYDTANYEWIDYFEFETVNGLFKAYIDKWNKIKVEAGYSGNTAMRSIAKLMNNNLYGKFGQSNDNVRRKPIIQDNHIKLIDFSKDEQNRERERESVYVPVAACCTSYARTVTIQGFNENYDNCAYCDTDSLHLVMLSEMPNLNIDPQKLGYWKHENNGSSFVLSKFIRPKTYIEVDKYGEFHITAGGYSNSHVVKKDNQIIRLNKSQYYQDYLGLSLKQFDHELVIPNGKRKKKLVEGGVIIVDGDFTIH